MMLQVSEEDAKREGIAVLSNAMKRQVFAGKFTALTEKFENKIKEIQDLLDQKRAELSSIEEQINQQLLFLCVCIYLFNSFFCHLRFFRCCEGLGNRVCCWNRIHQDEQSVLFLFYNPLFIYWVVIHSVYSITA